MIASNGHIPVPLATARLLLQIGVMPLPIPWQSKQPSNRRGWEDERYSPDDLGAFNHDNLNVGMRLGHILDSAGNVLSDRFADVDLDTIEATKTAPFFLPPTGMIWGHKSKRRSHYGFRLRSLEGARTLQHFSDPMGKGKRTTVCELRFSGQTLAPGSVNADGHAPETVEWEPDGQGPPAEVDFAYLEERITLVWASALIARYWVDGARHMAALPLAGMLCRGGMPQATAETLMKAICAASGDAQVDDRLRTISDTYAKAAANQPYSGAVKLEDFLGTSIVAKLRKLLKLRNVAGGDVGPDGFILSDIGNAERFHAKWEGKVRYCDDEAEWYIYDGVKWHVDRDNEIWVLALQVVADYRARIRDTNAANQGNASTKLCEDHLRKMEQARGLRDMLTIARALLPIRMDQFDADPNVLNCLDGTIILNKLTGTHDVHVHRPEDFITKLWNAHYNPNATHPDVDWYRQQFVPEQDRWEFLEEAMGYSLDGDPKRYAFQLLGESHAGKSMLLRIIREHSNSYGESLDDESLMPDKHGGGGKPRSDLKKLRGARVTVIPEVGKGAVWSSKLFKTMLSGGDFIDVRGAYEKRNVTFQLTTTLWTSGNAAYGADANDDAAYERTRVIKFEHPMAEGNRDDTREQQIISAERTGDAFLACWLRGFSRLYGEKHGRLTPPDSVVKATRALREELDPYSAILDSGDMVVVTGDEHDGVLVTELWDRVRLTREGAGERLGSVGDEKAALSAALKRRGAAKHQTASRFRNRDYWRGVRWAETFTSNYRVTLPDWAKPITETVIAP